MQEIEFWRTAVYHPLSVHFPIVIIILATLFKLLSLFNHKFKSTTQILIGLGLISTWIAYYTGSQADGEVSRTICDPTVLKNHENFALYLGYIISLIALIEFNLKLKIFKISNKWQSYAVLIGLIVSCVILTYVGHLGAELVYNQAAGVNIPSEDCREFE
ncbi:Uncharacterized membrane protein [Psychroflexus salarius]|uniref:Uncharacterized membrane protein n=1 Tax=Psychroflexus salarius TaxID=1155689 RepID=A0A1M4XEG4_9FLAO|nr:DUF2231 domain-containing protein [Psychroflexus salarius]SHE91813.1 Uncharacterized membrane protein [Psychroflexus salarius]